MSTEFINDQWRLPNAWNGSESNVNKQSNYSMGFDGASSISLGTPSSGIGVFNKQVFSFSVWVKRERQNVNETIVNLFASSSNRGVELKFQYYAADGNYLCLQIGDVTNDSWYNNRVTNINSIMSLNVWYNITCTWDGTDSNIYINNVLRKNWTKNLTISYITSNQPAIGVAPNNSSKYLGEIDSFSYFDYALSSSQITTLYGSSSTGIGNPMSLSPKPVAYYPLGDQDAFNGSNYLVPNIAAQEADGDIATSYSPYALDFDSASSDYINCGNDSSFNTNALTVSCWVKAPAFTPAVGPAIISKDGQGGTNRSFGFLFVYSSFLFQNWDSAGNENRVTIAQASNPINTDGQWHHLVATIDGTTNANGIKVYIDNVVVGQATATATGIRTSTVPFVIGGSGSTGSTYTWNGQISNVSYWNTALTSAQVTEIYNEGVPSNLNNHSAYSNLVSWWQLGSNSSFNTNWTVLDEKGSNNGTSSNMGEDAIVDGVGSYANGLSSGMGGDEVIGDAPYSSSNSLSVIWTF